MIQYFCLFPLIIISGCGKKKVDNLTSKLTSKTLTIGEVHNASPIVFEKIASTANTPPTSQITLNLAQQFSSLTHFELPIGITLIYHKNTQNQNNSERDLQEIISPDLINIKSPFFASKPTHLLQYALPRPLSLEDDQNELSQLNGYEEYEYFIGQSRTPLQQIISHFEQLLAQEGWQSKTKKNQYLGIIHGKKINTKLTIALLPHDNNIEINTLHFLVKKKNNN